MGREIRRVPPHWEHPKTEGGRYIRMYDVDFESALQEWLDGWKLWKKGEHPTQKYCERHGREYGLYWEEEGGPPNPEHYRPPFTEEPTWYQVYETVSEGTPVTPPFSSQEELVDYLVEYGDFWDQHRGEGGWPREHAEAFVKASWAPSGSVCLTEDGPVFKEPRSGA